jgi:hypothetical protein
VQELVFSFQLLVFRRFGLVYRKASAIAETMYFDVLANKKIILLLGILVLWVLN